MIFIYALIVFFIGFVFGWGARSFQFAADRDCANPDHKDSDTTI